MTGLLNRKKFIKTIAVTSGKGGIGKTNVTANLAIALQRQGKNVLILDSDFGMSNIDVLLGVEQRNNILHLLDSGLSLGDILLEGPHGIKILSAGAQQLDELDSLSRLKILDAFESYDADIDVLLIDTASGISENVTFFCTAAQEILIVTSPEPTSAADALALLKVLSVRYQENRFHVLVNFAATGDEALNAFHDLSRAAEDFGSISLDYLGYLPFDQCVREAVRANRGFVDFCPDNLISRNIEEIAQKLLLPSDRVKGTLQFFICSLLSGKPGQ